MILTTSYRNSYGDYDDRCPGYKVGPRASPHGHRFNHPTGNLPYLVNKEKQTKPLMS